MAAILGFAGIAALTSQFPTRPPDPLPSILALPIGFPEFPRAQQASQLKVQSAGHQDVALHSRQPQLPRELIDQVFEELMGSPTKKDMIGFTPQQQRALRSFRAACRAFFVMAPPMLPTALEVMQSDLATLFNDIIAYDDVLCPCQKEGPRPRLHIAFLHIYSLRIILEETVGLFALAPQAVKALPFMSDLREIQFVIRDNKPSMRFLPVAIKWFEVSGTAYRIVRLRLVDERVHPQNQLLKYVTPWVDMMPFVSEFAPLHNLKMISITSRDTALPSPLPFCGSVPEFADEVRSGDSVALQTMEAVFARQLQFYCPKLLRVYLHSMAGVPMMGRITGYWCKQRHGARVVYTAEPGSMPTIFNMPVGVLCPRMYDYDPFDATFGSRDVDADAAETAEDVDFNNALKVVNGILVRRCANH